MFKNLIKKATWLVTAGVLTGAFVNAQPVVKVPTGCKVVQLGTSTGPTMPLGGAGGRVGNGGIVCMPDPFDNPGALGDFVITTNGATILSWQLLGDISEQTATSSGAADQSAGAVLTVNIESYNKTVRTPAEDGMPSCKTLARSKGRVRINYFQSPCNNFIEFDILKEYPVTPVANTICGVGYPNNYIPPIIGPDCIVPNKTYTYSVDQIASDNAGDAIGFDKYYWSGIPAGSINFYTSADNSSITFTTPGTLTGPYTLRCCYGRCNPWDNDATLPPGVSATTCVTKTLLYGPVAPTVVVPPCVNTGTVSTALAVTGGTGNGTFTWGEFSPWSFSPTTGTSTTLSYNGDNNPQQITVTASVPGCLPNVVTTYAINRIYKSASVAITHAPAGVCLNAGSSYTFTVNPNALNNATTWRFPAGLVGAGIVTQNTTSATTTVTFLANAPAGQYKVWALSTACPSDSIVDSICIKPAVPVINSATCFTYWATGVTTITCTAVPGVPANGYTWNLPAGWACTAGCNTTNPTFSLTGTAVLPYGVLTVTAATTGSCACATTSINDTVWYNPITPNSITASCWNTNGAATGTTVLSVANAPNPFFGSYTINSVTPSVPYTGYTVNAQGGIVLTGVNAIPGTVYTFTITHTTPRCGNSPATPMNITAAEIPGVVQILPGPGMGNTDTYYVSPSPATPSYQWFVNGTAASATATQALLGNGPAPTSVCVNLLSSPVLLGTTSVCRKPQVCCTGPGCILGTHSLRIANGGAGTGIKGVSVYPNPNNGEFTITIPSYNTSATAILIDVQGKEVGNYTLTKGENAIVTTGLAKGLYNILLLIDDKSDSRKIEIK